MSLSAAGRPAAKFAACPRVKYSTFPSWVQKRRKRPGDGAVPVRKEPAALWWVEATKAGAARTLTVHLPGGTRLEEGDAAEAALAARLLRVFGGGRSAC